MITPPVNTPVFYMALFNERAAVELVRSISPKHAGDITEVLVTSSEMPSDMHAISECQASVNYVAALVGKEQAELKLNPIYLPSGPTIDDLELNSDGDITKIAGFSNPFTTASMTCQDSPGLIEAQVKFKPFDIPSLNDLLNNHAVLS